MGSRTIVLGVLGPILLLIVAIERTLAILEGEGDADVAIDLVGLPRASLHAMKSGIHGVGLCVNGGQPVLDEGIALLLGEVR